MKTIVLKEAEVFRGPLVLVNREHPLRTFDAELKVLPYSGSIRLQSRAAVLLRACICAAGGEHGIVPVSGWRSQEEQVKIWDDSMRDHGEAFTRSYVALPDCSEHQTGLAIDLAEAAPEIDFIRPAFPYDGVCGAFRRLAASYGFVERYQEEKRSLTGIAAEPWHFRYVGAPHAALLEGRGLCLEEYAAFLRRGDQVCRMGGKEACVRYLPCQGRETAVTIPEGCWQVSGDNAGGFILTLWR